MNFFIKSNELKRFYFLVFTPLILLSFLLSIFISSYVIFFSFGYIWRWVILTPRIEEKTLTRQYKYSFMKAVVHLENFFSSKWKIKSIIPTNIAVLCLIFLDIKVGAYIILGVIVSEFYGHFLFHKFSNKLLNS